MTKTTKLIWRLSSLPTPSELQELVKDKIITQEEAREILFTKEDSDERDKKSLESEIKFLRELVDKLSKDRKVITETIKYIEKPYYQYDWYQPYKWYCTSANNIGSNTVNAYVTTAGTSAGTISQYGTGNVLLGFKDIKTF